MPPHLPTAAAVPSRRPPALPTRARRGGWLRVLILPGLLPLLAASALPGALSAPGSPQQVTDDEVGEVPVRWIDWGAAGPARGRDSDLISQEHDALRRFLHAPEFVAAMVALAGECQQRQQQELRARLERCREAYCRREQTTALPASSHQTREVLPLPRWAWGLPGSVRASTQVLIFDDRDPRQRRWVLEHAHDDARMSYAYCTAWTSGDDRDRFWKEHPMLGIHPIASEEFAVCYGLTSYPARVRFESETMILEQGFQP